MTHVTTIACLILANLLHSTVHAQQQVSLKSGPTLVGDVKFDEVSQVASKISPVPGGVGRMTIAMLLANTVRAARISHGGAAGA